MTDMLLRDGLERYRSQVSILKKGYAQEKYRIDQICRSFLGDKITRDVTSVDIATYRDLRLQAINPQTKKPLSPSTVRLEMSLLSNFFDIGRIEWGICGDNPVKNVRVKGVTAEIVEGVEYKTVVENRQTQADKRGFLGNLGCLPFLKRGRSRVASAVLSAPGCGHRKRAEDKTHNDTEYRE